MSARPGCPPFESESASGGPPESRFLGAIPLGKLADQHVAVEMQLTTEATVHAALITLRSGDHLAGVGLISGKRLPRVYVGAVARYAGQRLSAAARNDVVPRPPPPVST